MQFPFSFIGKIAFWQWSHLRPFSDMDFWMQSWCAPLAPFWHPLGSTCHPVGFDWLPCGILLLPSRLILAPFGALGITLPAVEPHFVSISDFGGTNLQLRCQFRKTSADIRKIFTHLMFLWFLRHQISSKFTLRQPTSQST